MAILTWFLVQWQLSVFFQSFFLHRYAAHAQFAMGPRTERVFHFLAWFVMGPSYLEPRAYAILHRMHHAYSDTAKDPHSPYHDRNILRMMWRTKGLYSGLRNRTLPFEPRFGGSAPEWPLVDRQFSSWTMSIAWGTLYTLVYMAYAWRTGTVWVFALLPLHWFLGPIHGAIVNWFGHKLGYRNFENGDMSRNTLIVDFLTAGELFQNNHHKFGQSPNFAVRWFELDPTYQVMKALHALGIIDMSGAQVARYSPSREVTLPTPPLSEPSRP